MGRINIQDIINNVIEIPETPFDYLVPQEEYNSFYQRGRKPFDGSQEDYDFLAQKAFHIVNKNASYILTTMKSDQLLDVYQETEEDEEGIERPIGPIMYGPLFFLKKAIASQIFYWYENKQFAELNRNRQIADTGTNYNEGPTGFTTPYEELCNEAKSYIDASKVNQNFLLTGYTPDEIATDDEKLTEAIISVNSPGFSGRWKDSNTHGLGTADIALLKDILNPIADLQLKFPSGEFAQTDAMVEDTTPFGDDGESLRETNIRRDAQRDALIKTVDTLESQDNDSAVQRIYPNVDITINTGALPTHIPFTSDMVHQYVGVSDGYLSLIPEMQQMFIQYSMDCTLSGLVDKDEHTLGVYVGIRDIETAGSLKLQLIKEKSITINKETSEIGTLDVAISGDWTVISKILLQNMGAGSPEDLARLQIGLFVLCSADMVVNTGNNPSTDLLRGWAGNIITVGKGVGDGLLLASTNLIDMPSDLVAKKTLVVNDDGTRYIYGNEHYTDPEDASNKIVSTDGAGKIPNNLLPTTPQFTAWQYGYGTPYALITDLVDAIPGDLASKVELIQDASTPTITETYKLKLDGDPTEESDWLKVSETSPVDSVNSKTGVVQLDAIDIPYTDSTGNIGSTNTQGAITNLLGLQTTRKFIDNPDTPTTYENQKLKRVRVNINEDGLEFTDSEETLQGQIVESRENPITGEIEQKIRIPIIDDDIADEFLPWTTPINKYITTPAGELIYATVDKLFDTPDEKTGADNYVLVVNENDNSIEYRNKAPLSEQADVAIEIDDGNSGNNLKLWTGTQAQYDALGNVDQSTLYFIVG